MRKYFKPLIIERNLNRLLKVCVGKLGFSTRANLYARSTAKKINKMIFKGRRVVTVPIYID